MIDENKLIDDIKLLINKSFLGETTSQTQISVGEIATLINNQPKIGEWIPCESGKLPNEEVICCDKYGEMIIGYVLEDEESESGFCTEAGNVYMYDCVKWMELSKA